MVRGFGEAVKPARWERVAFRTGEGTLLVRHLRFSYIGKKPRVRGAALGIVHSGLIEAQFAVYGVSDIRGAGVLLSVVFPPSDPGTRRECRALRESCFRNKGIENKPVPGVALQTDAGRVAAIACVLRPGHGNRPARAPKRHG